MTVRGQQRSQVKNGRNVVKDSGGGSEHYRWGSGEWGVLLCPTDRNGVLILVIKFFVGVSREEVKEILELCTLNR